MVDVLSLFDMSVVSVFLSGRRRRFGCVHELKC
jgi:hypothetical protein